MAEWDDRFYIGGRGETVVEVCTEECKRDNGVWTG